MIEPGASSLQRMSYAKKNITLIKFSRMDTQHLSFILLHYRYPETRKLKPIVILKRSHH